MIINSIKLKNIRSYIDETINFPEGSIMLSGDIGCGKTSILLSIEFALFGIIRGQISGTTLLRHGANEGFVELDFSLDDKKIIIRRGLKRTSKSVAQDTGYIIINGEKQDLSPVELKSKILEIIGYPDELVTKSKAFIYRYTVYTPQEEMKHILFESKDERLNILRRIFDIDKYKRIKDNTLLYIKELKAKRTEYETRIEDLDDKKKELKEYEDKIVLIKKEKIEIDKELVILRKDLEEKELLVKADEEKLKEVQKLNSDLRLLQSNIENLKQSTLRSENDLKSLNESIGELSKELEGKEIIEDESLRKKIRELEERRTKLRENLTKINSRESEFKTLKKGSKDLVGQINALDLCPVCKQTVQEGHKHTIRTKEEANIISLDSQIEKLMELKTKREEELELIEKELSELNKNLSNNQVLILRQKQLKEKIEKKESLMKEQVESQKKQKEFEEQILELTKELENFKGLEEKILQAKKVYEEANQKVRAKEIKIAEFNNQEKNIGEFAEKIKTEIARKEESKLKLKKVNEVQEWLMKYIMNIVYLMEKQIMLRVHQEFNEYFQEWFNILIEDENLNVRLDETFTPIIEQNGYETYIENLSGGEKTSVALAYRLALNKVINDFIGTIRTKDLLILDEPTDGFSSEQLDKIRELLEAIRIKQVILVSHEPKLESYVDHITRVVKEEHVSRVIG